jgi:hypothetical protein
MAENREELQQNHRISKNATKKSWQQNHNSKTVARIKITAAKPATTNHNNKTATTDLAAAESWQFGNHIRFAYWNCSNCCMVWYRS